MKKKLVIAGIVILIGVAVFIINHLRHNKEEGVILLSGNVEVTESNMGFKLSGRVVERLVDEGYKVKRGDRLAILDSAELESTVAQSKANLNESLARLEELRTGSRPQELEQAKANLLLREAELSKAKKDYERNMGLYKEELVSAQQMDESTKAYHVAASLYENALQALSLVKEGPRKEEIKMAEHRVEQARASLRVNEERLKDTVIYAPTDGVVLRKLVELGETVSPGTPVFTIGDLAHPWIKVYVKEDKLGYVKLNQRAVITVDTYKGKKYEGTVTYISSEAEFTPKNVQTQEERVKLVFGIKVSVKNINDELKPGMPADVRIHIK
ncbi:MAG: efflux RND transporter periplasmic adaptor subunit [Proteobacteria bacterium]|nr:efflux RND transporter periplasmic adaptor subunit [Pseudomonadota bacterium]